MPWSAFMRSEHSWGNWNKTTRDIIRILCFDYFVYIGISNFTPKKTQTEVYNADDGWLHSFERVQATAATKGNPKTKDQKSTWCTDRSVFIFGLALISYHHQTTSTVSNETAKTILSQKMFNFFFVLNLSNVILVVMVMYTIFVSLANLHHVGRRVL